MNVSGQGTSDLPIMHQSNLRPNIYLERTRPIRDPNRALFVHFDLDKAHQPVSKATLGRWLMEAIRLSYKLLG